MLLLLLLIYMPAMAKDDGGIMISFGDVDFGGGQGSSVAVAAEPQTARPQSSSAPATDEYITQNAEQSAALEEQKRQEREQRETAERARAEQQRIAREQQQAIDRANSVGGLFGSGNEQGSGSSSGAGREGNPLGQGVQGGNSWSLDGRGLNGDLIQPAYNKNTEGRITINIRVDKSGKVTDARVDNRRTDISDAELRNAALNAARATRFTEGKNDDVTGTITYNFKLR
ncbi:MAG: TonB family protein [Paludibacter sp.]|nr:TonB family protein [Paludibacter sp.]